MSLLKKKMKHIFFNKKKLCICKQKNNTFFLAKIIMYVQVGKKRKEKRKEKGNWMRGKKKALVEKTFSISPSAQINKIISPSSFHLILGRKFFGRFGKKIPKSYHFFSSLPTQPNTL